MKAYPPAYRGQGHPLSNQIQGFFEFTLGYQGNIGRDIKMGRAGYLTGCLSFTVERIGASYLS